MLNRRKQTEPQKQPSVLFPIGDHRWINCEQFYVGGKLVVHEADAKTEEADKFVPPPPSAYGTWISEIMLQQTRVETVIPYWYRWMSAYPDVRTLAKQTPEGVNALWAGLGYVDGGVHVSGG